MDRPIENVREEAEDISRMYDLSVGRYDVKLSAGEAHKTKRTEAATQMLEMLKVFPQAAQIAGDLLVRNFDWPESDEIAERLEKVLPPQIKGQDPQIGMLLQQMEQMKQQHNQEKQMGLQVINELKKKVEELESDKSIDKRKADIDAYKAETDRLAKTSKDLNPDALRHVLLKAIHDSLKSPDILPPENEDN